ncbi:hypothetical protein [Paenibacillus contaminans]|uniref:hypothetical protein n=1 Tax=Paenibacillus contaminans TaxID=450362 RepID=UPI001314FF2A|nr:hypothetical protein [Paenibacillus contaminans]
MKLTAKLIITRAILFGLLAFSLRFVLDRIVDARDLLAVVIIIGIAVNEFFLRRVKGNH